MAHLTCLCQEYQVAAALLAVFGYELVGLQLLFEDFRYVVLAEVELVETPYQEVEGLSNAFQFSSVQFSSAQYDVQCRKVQFVEHSAVQCSTVQGSAVLCSAVQ